MIKERMKIIAKTTITLMAVALTITSCNVPTASDFSSSNVSSSSEVEEKQPVTLTILGPSFEKAFPNGIQEDEIAKAIKEATGVTLDWVTGNGISDFDVYQNTKLASNDFEDIVYTTTSDNVFRKKIMTAGAALPLDELIETNGGNITANAADMIKISKAFKSDASGSLYFLGTSCNDDGRVPGNFQGVPFIRWDLYKAIGSPQITTETEMLSALKQMQDKFPTNDEGKKAYAMSGFFASWGTCMPERIYTASMGYISAGAASCLFYNYKDPSQTIDGYSLESPYIKGARFINKAYQMGLLDPDAFTMEFEQYLDKVKAGRVYYNPDSWTTYDPYNPVANDAGKTDSGFAPIWYLFGSPENPKGTAYGYSPDGQYDYWISKNCETPDRAIDLFNYLYSYEGSELVQNGIEGTHWDMVDGEPQMKDSVLALEASDPEYRVTSGVYKYTPLAGFTGTALDDHGFAVNFRSSMKIKEKTLTAFEKSYCAEVGESIPGESFITKMTDKMDYTIQSCLSFGDDEELNAIANALNEYNALNYVKLLTPKTDAEWYAAYDEFVEGHKALGSEKLYDAINEILQEMVIKLK